MTIITYTAHKTPTIEVNVSYDTTKVVGVDSFGEDICTITEITCTNNEDRPVKVTYSDQKQETTIPKKQDFSKKPPKDTDTSMAISLSK